MGRRQEGEMRVWVDGEREGDRDRKTRRPGETETKRISQNQIPTGPDIQGLNSIFSLSSKPRVLWRDFPCKVGRVN